MNFNIKQVLAELSSGGFEQKREMPSRKIIISIIKSMQSLMFPGFFEAGDGCEQEPEERLSVLTEALVEQIEIATGKGVDYARDIAEEIIAILPMIQRRLMKDVRAIYEGDPAASCCEEVVLSYPGFYAISIYRIAHEFYLRKIPFISRIMTEFAHEKTGIDIHAGATVGDYFCIDHGTGIVIGETTVIGDRVKIYQGVTLGAKSFELDENGNPVKGIKRHPEIGNNVVIYANATILGGNTKIGDNCVIGGNVWLTHSVPEGKVVYYNSESKGKKACITFN